MSLLEFWCLSSAGSTIIFPNHQSPGLSCIIITIVANTTTIIASQWCICQHHCQSIAVTTANEVSLLTSGVASISTTIQRRLEQIYGTKKGVHVYQLIKDILSAGGESISDYYHVLKAKWEDSTITLIKNRGALKIKPYTRIKNGRIEVWMTLKVLEIKF